MTLPILNLTGDRVALGPLRSDLVPLYERWQNDFEVGYTTVGLRVMTAEAAEEWYREHCGPGHATFTIYELRGLRPIGTTGLFDINHQHRRAEFGLRIGEKDCWGKGYGTEVTRLVLGYGFGALSLHHIFLRVVAYNRRGLRAYERAGFRVIGRRRQAHWLGGQAHDIVFMDCLASEFSGPIYT